MTRKLQRTCTGRDAGDIRARGSWILRRRGRYRHIPAVRVSGSQFGRSAASSSGSALRGTVGTVFQGEIVHQEFHLQNRSDAEMRIVGARTTCGCTLFPETLIATLIRPHGSVVVPVEYHSGLGDGPISGDLEITVAGKGIDYIVRGSLRGEVVAEFTIEPQLLDFGSLRPGEEVTRTVLFRPKACPES